MVEFIFIMRKIICASVGLLFLGGVHAQSWVRVNRIGYLPDDVKVAVWVSKEKKTIDSFEVADAQTGKRVYRGEKIVNTGKQPAFESSVRLHFSELTTPGTYVLRAGGIQSVPFRIGYNVYAEAAEMPLRYMRQQRCGYNPCLKDSCHTHGVVSVGDPDGKRNGIPFDVSGGWHDASDYLQYVTTSANAVYQMLFAYSQHPEAFGDRYQANGDEGANGIPDILDEARWGIDWLVKMNPDSVTYFNQLADDRDHAGFTLPADQRVDYGWGAGKARPVYFCSSLPQGLKKYRNRSTGLASTLGKYASSFALGASVLSEYDPEFSKLLLKKSEQAYLRGAAHPGVCQTALCGAPYFYEEDNWADDMQLAATEMYALSGKKGYLKQAVQYGRMEPVTPWMGADSARHYQWYPFVNLGHYRLATQGDDPKAKQEFIRHMRSGLQRVKERAQGDAFLNGIPFIWCSNNLTVAFITQCRLYHELTGDKTFLEVEAAMRDWLFGCNPWGKCMMVGYPAHGDTPSDPHSALTHLHGMPVTGGLVDGPIYTSIFGSLIGVHLSKEDRYAPFQSDVVVYHDDYADYSTNEPTMDGTASLCYYLGYLSAQAHRFETVQGGIVRGDRTEKKIALVFTGHEYADGAGVIRRTLKKHQAQASFFLTGDFYRKFPDVARRLQKEGHYLAPHSDRHLLYADWQRRDSTLVSRTVFEQDLEGNYAAMQTAGLKIETPRFFIPSYEWYNHEISGWAKAMDVQVVNFTPGTRSNADYTTPEMKSYRSSEAIYRSILAYEAENDLNGFILLLHIGTDPKRTDKFYNFLSDLMHELKQKNYIFVRIDELMAKKKRNNGKKIRE